MLEVPVYLHPLRQPREVLCPILQAYVAFFEATLADLASTTGSLSVGEAMEQPLTVQRVTTKARHRLTKLCLELCLGQVTPDPTAFRKPTACLSDDACSEDHPSPYLPGTAMQRYQAAPTPRSPGRALGLPP